MDGLDAVTIFYALFAVQLVGLGSAWLARMSEGSRCQGACQCFFFLCMVVVGTVTVLSLHVGPGWWLTSGTTLSLMALAATYDISGASRTVNC